MNARYAIAFLFAFARIAGAQFSPAFLQNSSYWAPGKSEFNFYDADFMRDGQKHSCDLLMIFTPEFVDHMTFAATADRKDPNAFPVIRLNQIATIPRGLVFEQRSLTAMWEAGSGNVAQIWFNSSDGINQVFKILLSRSDPTTSGWTYSTTVSGEVETKNFTTKTGTAFLYDELPLRVRMLDFSKTSGEAELQVAPTLASATKELGDFKPAKLSWKAGERDIAVDVAHENGKDHFVLDRDFPYLLREWQMADGSRLKMKNSLRVNYRDYMKNGDREKALKDPMLQHPD